jgi:hypothetical protein
MQFYINWNILYKEINKYKGGSINMNKKVMIVILVLALVFTVLYFYFPNAKEAVGNKDTQLINRVVEIEKNLVLSQAGSMTLDDFKNETDSYIYSTYKAAYFDEIERAFNRTGGFLAESTKTPIYQYISKVYTDTNQKYKSIYIKIPVEETTSQLAKLYIFKKENDQWKISSVTNYILTISRNEPKRIIEKFANYNDVPIEYEYIKVLNHL